MTGSVLSLPRDVPWKQLAVSPDMMDTDFCDRTFPFRWRSSLAVSAFEPALDDLPEGMCDERLTYLRVTSTITGYQAAEGETQQPYQVFPNVPTEELDRLMGQYFACYGVVLNVAVFPGPNSKEIESVERRTVDFSQEPLDAQLANPFDREGARFEQPGQGGLQVVALFTEAVEGRRGLSFSSRRDMTVTLPPTRHVDATIIHASAPVTLQAFSGETLVDRQDTDPEPGQSHLLTFTGDGIDRLLLQTAEGEASLLQLVYEASATRPAGLSDYPHIVDFEPKTRDLYQAATETGEILTASVSSISTDKTLTHTETSETGLALSSTYESPETPYGKGSITGSWAHKWGDTDADARAIGIDASRDRRESQGSSTNISQLYNLLTGYHVGTNRATFMMLPRPHIMQPTDRRTFIQGLRIIEGVQEYFLVVTRPRDTAGMSVEVMLETGHFPEDVVTTEPPERYEESEERFVVTAYAKGGHGPSGNADTVDIMSDPSSTHMIQEGWIVDKRPGKGDADHPGVEELANDSDDEANSSLRSYNYQASDSAVQVSGRISGKGQWRSGANFNRKYRVLTRRSEPIDDDEQPSVDTPFLITARGLCVRYRSTADCPVVVPPPPNVDDLIPGDWVVDETNLQVAALTSRKTPGQRLPAMKEALRQLQFAMARSPRMPSRRPFGQVGYLESDYFGRHISKHIPPRLARQAMPAAKPEQGESPSQVLTLEQVLSQDLMSLQRSTGLSAEEIVQARRTALGLLAGDSSREAQQGPIRGEGTPPDDDE
jgi:hypothetical protein